MFQHRGKHALHLSTDELFSITAVGCLLAEVLDANRPDIMSQSMCVLHWSNLNINVTFTHKIDSAVYNTIQSLFNYKTHIKVYNTIQGLFKHTTETEVKNIIQSLFNYKITG